MTEREPSMLKPDGAELPPAAPAAGARPRDATEPPVVAVAGFWHRFLAALVDAIAIAPVAWLVCLVAAKLGDIHLPEARQTGIDYWLDLALAGEPALWGAICLCATVMVIYLLLFQSMAGRTLGMRLLRLRVIDVYGDPPTVLRAGARTIGYLVGFATFLLGFLWIGFDREKRGLHDWIAGTYVIKAGKP